MEMNSKKKDKILILSASFGDGHKQVANALSEAIQFTLPNVEPVTIDIMEWLHPYLFPISHYFYNRVIKKFPQVYSYFYKRTREKSSFSVKLNTFFTLGMGSMLNVIEKIQPIVVVSTYPFAAGIMSKLKEHGLVDIPTVTVITDYTDHSYWIYPFTDHYIVGSKQVKDRLVSLGIEGHKINHSGIPVLKKFMNTQSREVLAKTYHLNPSQFTLLVMGGGEGFIGKGISTFQALENLSSPIQIIIVCGRNKKLRNQLEKELRNTKHHILLLGYSENIHELMALSDLMISKPGGVTTSEALTMELPLLLYHPLPGQEEDNAQFLVDTGLALLAKNDFDLIGKIEVVTKDVKSLNRMKQRARQYQSKTSSVDALDIIMQTRNQVYEQKSAFIMMPMRQSV
ncbi:1,2-diacylglycerol 3-glucosyltransferase [Neobacillus bataviensis LMG 21833]|uniref:1,2-diacylglycerol 3-glucosyltransferase n=1 Tax=Neobacillus bataviensis LMG 21833 TaxID=1117379 RepID=K6C0U2_9BACI|nr:glycosyltransferase [Neobacillus bataviensis]EKN64780.1 1,2-diacylglycerol 3-glucosyltransferase [Neobacillus bataviensis LMG 21833]